MKTLSEKGKHFNGDLLNEDNLHAGQKVACNGLIFITGNRYKGLVELYRGAIFDRIVKMKDIKLIKEY